MAKCIYNKGCDAGSTLNDFPAYVQPLGTLVVNEDTECAKILLKNWNSIISHASCYEDIFDVFTMSGYNYLETFEVSPTESYAFGRTDSVSLTFESISF